MYHGTIFCLLAQNFKLESKDHMGLCGLVPINLCTALLTSSFSANSTLVLLKEPRQGN